MNTSIIESNDKFITIQIKIPLSESYLETETRIQSVLNEAGTLGSGEALKYFDTDGSAIEVEGKKWTSKGQQPKTYQTPYGSIEINRHVYQSSTGGETYCPLEVAARIIITSTPRFAKQISHKYAEMSSVRLVEDFRENHGREVNRAFVQILAEAVGSIAMVKEEKWTYQTPKLDIEIPTVSIGLDGTCMLMSGEGYRQAMAGTITLYDIAGERQHTTYIAASPEYGRETFLTRLRREVERVKQLYPNAHYQGLADGAPENWTFLNSVTTTQILDFYHATQYLDRFAKAIHPRSLEMQKTWMDTHCHKLKHDPEFAMQLLTEMQIIQPKRVSKSVLAGFQDAITYFRNHHHQMHYAQAITANLPIGSGITEAACKVIIKARLCCSGMKWKDKGASIVLSLRALSYTKGRWQQFWDKINRYGFAL
jgi:hypothetical protein